MIFAAATDDNSLMVFADVGDAIAYCEGVDVEDGGWQFWDEMGVALAPEILTPGHRGQFGVGGGTYRLVPAPHLCSLADNLAALRSLERNMYFSTIAAVRTHLATVAPVPQHGA